MQEWEFVEEMERQLPDHHTWMYPLYEVCDDVYADDYSLYIIQILFDRNYLRENCGFNDRFWSNSVYYYDIDYMAIEDWGASRQYLFNYLRTNKHMLYFWLL